MTNQYYFLGTRTTFIRAVPKIFCSVTGTLLSSLYNHHLLFCLSLFCTPGLCLKQRHITVSSYKLTNWLQYILVPRASVSFGHVLGTNRIIILVPSATREWVFIFFWHWESNLEGIARIAMDKNVDDVSPTSSTFREDNGAGIEWRTLFMLRSMAFQLQLVFGNFLVDSRGSRIGTSDVQVSLCFKPI